MSKYKFSVIIPIYNVEKYLEETIESVIHQTIGFTDNIQMILVNDGSPDDSESICLKYKELYPNNIIYIKQQNQGVSSARNSGLRRAEGEYVNFLDSDDKWEKDAFEKAYAFFKQHESEVDMVACKMRFFEAGSGYGHVLNYKFDGDRVVDLNEEYDYVQMSSSSCFIKRSAIKHEYNTNLTFTEDSLFINRIILEKCKYGIMNSVDYLYRKRLVRNSAVDTWKLDSGSYNNNMIEYNQKMMCYSREKYGEVIPYIQFVMMYELQWRLKAQVSKEVLSENEFNEYKAHISEILKEIDDKIILSQRYISAEVKMYALSLKHGEGIFDELKYESGDLSFNGNIVYSLHSKSMCMIKVINIGRSEAEICGSITCPLPIKDYTVYYQFDDNVQPLELKSNIGYDFYNKFCVGDNFEINKSLNKTSKNTFKFYIKYKQEDMIPIDVDFSVYGRLTSNGCSHYVKNGYMLYKENKSIVCEKHSALKSFKFELLYYRKNISNLKPLIYRTLYHFFRLFKIKPVWLISDGDASADEKMMLLFEHLNKYGSKINVYFAADKNSKEYEQMRQYGKVLAQGSLMHKIKFLLADKLISSRYDNSVVNIFGLSEKYYRDIYKFDFVYWPFESTCEDLSCLLNKLEKNIKLFITSTSDEYNAVIDDDYGYGEEIVKLIDNTDCENIFEQVYEAIIDLDKY